MNAVADPKPIQAPFNAPVETTKLIVVPNRSDLAARILAIRRSRAQVLAQATVTEDVFSGVLDVRRQALREFGQSVTKVKRPLVTKASSPADISTMADSLVEKLLSGQSAHDAIMEVQAALPDQSGVNVLGSLGVVIVDADSIDLDAVQARHAQVLQNVPIPLIGTVSTSALPDNPNAWHLPHIHADTWHQNGVTGKGMTVGMLDTGIDPGHPEFAGKSILFHVYDKTAAMTGSAAHDTGQHGTHVAGLIAGKTVGVAPDASLAVAAVLTEPGSNGENYGYLAQILAGLDWLVGLGNVYIINGSFGGSGYNNYYYSTLEGAIDLPGTLLVAAIGNSGLFGINQHGSPGNYDIVVGVGATDNTDAVCAFSDWGTQGTAIKPDFCAPGGAIYSSLPGGTYGLLSGTSMASPIVAGAAALVLQHHPELVANATALDAKLRSMVRPLSGPRNVARGGAGILDLTSL
jgi:subtilisin family serine protease